MPIPIQEEIVTIVDEENRVVGAAPRSRMRGDGLPHRATYILVFNDEGEIFVQKRTTGKDIYPGYYDVATGGVVLAGESYDDAAMRELAEELG
ncbi:MAG: NUDIX domain-containing protein, partial [Desulfobacterales bacterium]